MTEVTLTQSAPAPATSPLLRMSEAEIRQAVEAQCHFSRGPNWGSWPLEQQQQWVRDAERRLWGASIVMQQCLGYKPRAVRIMKADGDELEQTWLALYMLIAEVKNAWDFDTAWAWIEDRHARRTAIYNEVMAKLGKPVAASDVVAAAALAPTP